MFKRLMQFTTIGLLLSLFLATGLSCGRGGSTEAQQALKTTTLKFWFVNDDTAAYDEIIQAYRLLHPNVYVEMKKLRFDEYQNELIKALALGEGPDIFAFHNTWTNKYKNMLEPMPASVRLPTMTTVGTLKKEQVVQMVVQNLYTAKQVRSMYGDTVADDAVIYNEENQTYNVMGLPLSLDTLALYYNRDILNNAGVPLPAVYWTDAQAQVERIRRLDTENNILVSALPIGTAYNVTRSFDILSLLMMQLQTEMINDRGAANFHEIPNALRGQENITQPPGVNALEFYTSFAEPALVSYNWNAAMPDSLTAFINGQSAYFLGYSYHRPTIDAQAPRLNYDIAPMLQIQGYDRINYANYWFNGVSARSANKDFAWDFVRFMSTGDQALKYLNYMRKPAALRSLYDAQIGNEELAVFVEQTLTAKSWYRGNDSDAVETIFKEMINSVNQGLLVPRDSVGLAVQKVQQTLR